MPPHYQADTARSKREARSRKRKYAAAKAGELHDYEPFPHTNRWNSCRWCGYPEAHPAHMGPEARQERLV